MLTDDQILRRCRRILGREGLQVSRVHGGYSVHPAGAPASDGNYLWSIDRLIDLADLSRERQAEYKARLRERQTIARCY